MRVVHPGGAFFWVHDVIWLLIVIAVVIGVILIVRVLMERPGVHGHGSGQPYPPSAALQELDMRYARGEVARDEYLRRRADLSGHPPPQTPTS
ncbi:MAG: SHOCT domain-containing protein [Candidatus Dormibacteria bacterium]